MYELSAREVRKLDEELKKKITKNEQLRKILLEKLQPRELLQYMTNIYVGTKERIIQKEKNQGRRLATGMFLDEVHRYSGWGRQFLNALHWTGHACLAKKLKSDYEPPSDDDHGGGGSHGGSSHGGSSHGGGGGDGRGNLNNDDFAPGRRQRPADNPYPPSYEDSLRQQQGRFVHFEDQMRECRKYNQMMHQPALHAEPPPPQVRSQQLSSIPDYSLQAPRVEPETFAYDPPHIESSPNSIPSTFSDIVEENDANITDQNANLRFNCLDRLSGAASENVSTSINSLPNSTDKVLRKQTRNDLSSNRNTSNHQSILSVNETFSMNNPEEDVGSTNTISASKARHSELPDQSCLKEEANGETENSCLPFYTVSYRFSTEKSVPTSKEITPSQLKISVESQSDDQNTNESYRHEGERTPILVSHSSNEDPLENLSRSSEEKLISIDTSGNGTNQNTNLADNTEANPESSDRILESLLGTVNAIPMENRKHDSNEDLINLNPNASIVPHNEDSPMIDSQPRQTCPLSPQQSGIIVKDSFGDKSEACCKQSEMKGNDPKPEVTNSDKSKNVKVDFSCTPQSENSKSDIGLLQSVSKHDTSEEIKSSEEEKDSLQAEATSEESGTLTTSRSRTALSSLVEVLSSIPKVYNKYSTYMG